MRNGRLLTTLVVLGALWGCEKERHAPAMAEEAAPRRVVTWTLPGELEPLVTEMPTGGRVEIGGTHRHPECWESLERDGKPLDPFPFAQRDDRAEHLASCGVEALATLPDGADVVAYGTAEQPGSRARDLRLVVWEPDGRLRFVVDLDRSRQAPNWAANFRRSFIAPLPPKHICAGTLWEGDTQVTCVNPESGLATWTGSLPFWSGINPQAVGDGLVVADLSAMTKRYPFNGTEMSHRKLEGLGGRAGYYSTDGKRLFFAPSRIDAPPLIAYDLSTLEEIWRTQLPASPTANVAHAFGGFNVVLIKLDEQLIAVDATSGAVKWGYTVEDEAPSIDADAESIYVLVRRPDVPNRLVALDPATGERRWSTDTPGGTLRTVVVDDRLFIGSVRAVQRVTRPEAPEQTGSADGG